MLPAHSCLLSGGNAPHSQRDPPTAGTSPYWVRAGLVVCATRGSLVRRDCANSAARCLFGCVLLHVGTRHLYRVHVRYDRASALRRTGTVY